MATIYDEFERKILFPRIKKETLSGVIQFCMIFIPRHPIVQYIILLGTLRHTYYTSHNIYLERGGARLTRVHLVMDSGNSGFGL